MFKKHWYILFLIPCLFSCDEECEFSECGTSLANGAVITVSSNVSGGEGTQITPDIIDTSSITTESATVKFSIKKIGSCHTVIGYGHTWSSIHATPRTGTDTFSDYENNVNFNDEVTTVMRNLTSNTTYWVRSWIAIEGQACDTRKRVVFYNDKVSEFRTH